MTAWIDAPASGFQRAVQAAYDRMTEAQRHTPCACRMIPWDHVKAECAARWHRQTWHGGQVCDCVR